MTKFLLDANLSPKTAAFLFGIIVLRLRNQRRLAVEQTLTRFFQEQAPPITPDTSLVIIEDAGIRVRSFQ